jgi:phosphate transport system substrate-binding protein
MKKMKIKFLIMFIIIGLGSAFLFYILSMDRLSKVEDREYDDENINLWGYMPFRKNNQLSKLDEISTLKLNSNLPVLDGATAFFPVYSSFVQAVYPEGDYTSIEDNYYFRGKGPLLCSKTKKAYENLLEGKVDIIFCLEPSDLHLKQIHDNGLNVKFIPIGREAFVFFVNKENPVDNLTIENIRSIYSGKILYWKELNGVEQDIIAFQRPKHSGSQTIFEKIMGNANIIEPQKENIATEMGDIINMIAEYKNFPNAIGYSFLYYSTGMIKNEKIKLLSVNGIFPSDGTIRDGTYPFSENIYAVYIDTYNKNENIEQFIEWILSSQGQTLILESGYIPINK